jgi:2TM domain
MPPRWSRKPDRKDPDYRKLDDRMNFAVHVATFACINSGVWFFRIIQKADWAWSAWLTLGWLTILIAHALFIFAIADYSGSAPPSSPNEG